MGNMVMMDGQGDEGPIKFCMEMLPCCQRDRGWDIHFIHFIQAAKRIMEQECGELTDNLFQIQLSIVQHKWVGNQISSRMMEFRFILTHECNGIQMND